MPERIVAPNSGVPMSNSNGGTQETGGDQTQGGGAANPGVGSVGTSGTSNAPSSSSASNDLMLAELTSAITAYLAVGAILPGDDFIMDLYMDNKLGFKTIEKDLEEANPEVDKKTIKDLVKAEKEKTKAFLQGPGKAAFKDKLDQLKIEIKDMQSTMGSVAQEVTMSITDAFMPPVVGPVAPNPLSSVTNFLSGNKGAADSLAKATAFKKSHINNGGSPIPQLITAAYNAQSEANKAKARSQAIANANGSSLDFT